MTVWHWVRHGPTHEKALVGWRDVPADLSDTAQVAKLRDHLPDQALLVSSDLIRASATADAIQAPGHARLADTSALREFHFGAWDGLHFSDVAQRDPELSRAYWETPGDVAPPEGESWNAAARRINACVDALTAAHPDAHIIATAHIGVILTQVQRGLGVTPFEALSHSIDNLSCTRIVFAGAETTVHQINHRP
ncbi:histidine phosphatase family protein [Roseobacter sinensis]|uniref:Histidine phosphatase family protein n=1 Tax=Roseobacter sinensis TaxID=2931391 RepID=A0ABT3BCY1_9RHOB|nr:histidine phosphatase family protein [Roseobacter sp. WL0113]MCV3271426.1 histidine phosphatase family protein [Roseobacter sp. WL0113]